MLANKVQAAAKVVAGGGSETYYVAVSWGASPFVKVYPWSSATGWGVAYSDPSTLPGTGNLAGFSPSGDVVFCGNGPDAYRWSAAGFGTKYTNPGVSSGTAFSAAPNGTQVVYGNSFAGGYIAWPWSYATGYGTKYSDPSPATTSATNGICFSPSSNAIAIATQGSPYIYVYAFSGSGWGSKFADPATLPTGVGRRVAFNPSETAIAIAHDTTPYITAYPWSGSGFGTKYADPAVLPAGAGSAGRGVAFSPSGNAIAVTTLNTPRLSAYAWSGSGFGTKYANPATLPNDQARNTVFASDNTAIFTTQAFSPWIFAHAWSDASGFGTLYSNPSVLPTGTPNDVAFGKIVA